MEELIKKAESLCENLDKLQRKLPLSIYDNDTLIKIKCLLRVIIERKDNIVDLGEVWHDNKHIPQSNKKIIAIKSCGDTFCGVCNVKNGFYLANIASDITSMSSWDDVAKWAYLEGLLPKGDNK